jgi:type III secretion protein T
MEKSFLEYPLAWTSAFFFAMPRLLALFSVVPLFSKQALPGLLRIGVAASVAIFVVPSLVSDSLARAHSSADLLAIIFKEVLIGFLLGFLISIPLWVFDLMGTYIDNQRGASIASSINPLTGHDSSPLGELFSQAIITFLLISGGYMLVLTAIYESYSIWPVFSLLPKITDETPLILLQQMDRLMRLTVLLSAPVIFSMFLAEIGLGLVSRFVPQLQVFFIAMPIKSALAMFIFSVYIVTLFDYAADEIQNIGTSSIRVIQSIFPKVLYE